MRTTILLLTAFCFLTITTQAQTVTDIDGNTYNTITIGTQTWMQENLKTTHFRNGDSIETTTAAIDNGPTSIYQWYYNEDTSNLDIYGRLYTWYAVTDTRNVCPTGWHVPSYEEWITLSDFLGGDTLAGSKMKDTGIIHWAATDSSVTNSTGFTGLPGGFRGNPSGYTNIGITACFWTSTQWGSSAFLRAYTFLLKSGSSWLEESVAVGNCGMSVRCIQDEPAGTGSAVPGDNIRVFPNPTTGLLTISVADFNKVSLSVYDLTGVLVFQHSLTKNVTSIDLNSLSNGVYVIRISGPSCRYERKLVKE